MQVPLRTTDRPEWLAFVVPRVPAGWYTPFFDAPPGCPFMAAGSTDTQRFFEILPAQPDTSTARADLGSADPAPDRHGFVMGLAFIAALAFRLAWSPRGGSR